METVVQVYLWQLEIGLLTAGFIVVHLVGNTYRRNGRVLPLWRRIGWYLGGAVFWLPIAIYALVAYLTGCMPSKPFYIR